MGAVIAMYILGVIVGVFAVVAWIVWDDEPAWHEQRDRQLRAELEGLRAANRINAAFWCAKEEMEAEADRHREAGDRPW